MRTHSTTNSTTERVFNFLNVAYLNIYIYLLPEELKESVSRIDKKSSGRLTNMNIHQARRLWEKKLKQHFPKEYARLNRTKNADIDWEKSFWKAYNNDLVNIKNQLLQNSLYKKDAIELSKIIKKLFSCAIEKHYRTFQQMLPLLLKYDYPLNLLRIKNDNGETLLECIRKNRKNNILLDMIYNLFVMKKPGLYLTRVEEEINLNDQNQVNQFISKKVDEFKLNAQKNKNAILVKFKECDRVGYTPYCLIGYKDGKYQLSPVNSEIINDENLKEEDFTDGIIKVIKTKKGIDFIKDNHFIEQPGFMRVKKDYSLFSWAIICRQPLESEKTFDGEPICLKPILYSLYLVCSDYIDINTTHDTNKVKSLIPGEDLKKLLSEDTSTCILIRTPKYPNENSNNEFSYWLIFYKNFKYQLSPVDSEIIRQENWKNEDFITEESKLINSKNAIYSILPDDTIKKISFHLIKYGDDNTPLRVAAACGENEIVDNLIKIYLLTNRKKMIILNYDDEYNTPLHYAAREGHIKIIETLLLNGVYVDSGMVADNNYLHINTQITGKTPLYYAVQSGHIRVIELLLNRRATVNPSDRSGKTPLHYAVQSDHIGVIELLLSKGANVNAVDSKRMTPFYYAVQSGHIEVIELLLDRGATVNPSDCYHKIPLHYVAEYGRIDIVELLLSKGADVNAVDSQEMAPLHYAVRSGHTEVIKLLLEKTANVKVTDNINKKLLFSVINRQNIEMLELFLPKLDKSVNIEMLMYAANRNFNVFLRLLNHYEMDDDSISAILSNLSCNLLSPDCNLNFNLNVSILYWIYKESIKDDAKIHLDENTKSRPIMCLTTHSGLTIAELLLTEALKEGNEEFLNYLYSNYKFLFTEETFKKIYLLTKVDAPNKVRDWVDAYEKEHKQLEQEIATLTTAINESSSRLMNTKTNSTYIESITHALNNIKNDRSLTTREKKLEIESYMLNVFREIKSHDRGLGKSKLRKKLQDVMKNENCFGLTHRYGVKFTSNDTAICGREFLNHLMHIYKNKLIEQPELYTYGLKFITKLNEIASKTQKKEAVKKLEDLIYNLLEGRPPHDLKNFEDTLKTMLTSIQIINEKHKFFFSKASYMEKFLNDAISDFNKLIKLLETPAPVTVPILD